PLLAAVLAERSLGRARPGRRSSPPLPHGRGSPDGACMNMTFIPPEWLDLGPVSDIPLRGARSVPVAGGEEIAVFRTGDDRVYALVNRCPHKGGPLSQGIVHGDKVACPLHDWKISLVTGE